MIDKFLFSEHFLSDPTLFKPDIYTFLEYRAKEDMLLYIKTKHLHEKEDDYDYRIKQQDLIIWNAMFTREASKKGIVKKHLASLYNAFHHDILKCTSLIQLQEMEISMVHCYLDVLIYDVEVHNNYILNRIITYLYLNIETYFTLENLAEELGISVGYASACFKKHMDISIMKYSKQLKIERAKILLTSTTQSIFEIATLLGFHDQSHFSRTFKSFVGQTPIEYRNKKAE